MNDPTDEHWKAAKPVSIYACDTETFSITLGGNDKTLTTHYDSDWAKQVEDHRSTTEFYSDRNKKRPSMLNVWLRSCVYNHEVYREGGAYLKRNLLLKP